MTATVNSTGDLLLESMPDAPDAEWLRAFLTDYNNLKRQVVPGFGRIGIGNTGWADKTLSMVHGTEYEVSHGLPDGVALRSVVAQQVEGLTLDSAGAPTTSTYALGLAAPIAWRPSATPGKVFVNARYAAPNGAVDLVRSAAQSIATATATPVQWTSADTVFSGDLACDVATTSGTPPVNSKIVCASSGVVLVTAGAAFVAGGGSYREFFFQKNNTQPPLWGDFVVPAGLIGAQLSAQIPVSAGDYLQMIAYQNTGGNIDLTGSRLQARYVAPAAGTTGRVRLLFVGE